MNGLLCSSFYIVQLLGNNCCLILVYLAGMIAKPGVFLSLYSFHKRQKKLLFSDTRKEISVRKIPPNHISRCLIMLISTRVHYEYDGLQPPLDLRICCLSWSPMRRLIAYNTCV